MKRRLIYSLAVSMLLVGVRCSAGTLTLTSSGIWANGAPTSTESAPGESWSLSFQVDSNPVPLNYTTGVQTVVPITNLIFDLNGSPVQTEASGGSVELFTGEGFRLYFPDGDALQIQDIGQLYSGTEASPTVLPGNYPAAMQSTNAFLYVSSTSSFYYFSSNSIAITGAAVPEPSSFLMFGAGLAALAAVAARKII